MINLLPTEEKEKIYQYRLKRMMLILGFIGTVFVIALASLLLTLKIHLEGEIGYQNSILEAKKGKSRTEQINQIQGEFASYNKKIANLNEFYQEQDYPSGFLKEVESVLPPSVYLTTLSYEKELTKEHKAEVSIAGFCPDRETLFSLKEAMDKKSNWKDIRLPPSNWVEPVDISFNVNFKVQE
ncbi:MAG: hypothetical protein V5A57_02115 [Candidatus Paceibacterota bacterium]